VLFNDCLTKFADAACASAQARCVRLCSRKAVPPPSFPY